MELTPVQKEKLEYYIEVFKSVEYRDSLRHSLWNAIIICNSFFLASFTILVTINSDSKRIKDFVPFIWILLLPIVFCLTNHVLSYFVINKRMWQRLEHFKFLRQEAYPNSDWPHKEDSIFKKHHHIFIALEWSSIALTAFVIAYLLCILIEFH